MRIHVALVVLGLVGMIACSGAAQPAPALPSNTKTTDPATAPAPGQEVVTLRAVSQGDLNCYVEVTTAAGQEMTYRGVFDLCPGGERDASALIGKPVTFRMIHGSFPAPTCEGDPCCPDHEEAELVDEITAAP